jgi:hypothetical protein
MDHAVRRMLHILAPNEVRGMLFELLLTIALVWSCVAKWTMTQKLQEEIASFIIEMQETRFVVKT